MTCMHSELAIYTSLFTKYMEMGSEKFLIDGVPTLHSRQTFEKVCYVIFYTASTVSSCMIYGRSTFIVVGSVTDPSACSSWGGAVQKRPAESLRRFKSDWDYTSQFARLIPK